MLDEFDATEQEADEFGFVNPLWSFEDAFLEQESEATSINCAAIPTNCDMTTDEVKKVKKAGKPEGDFQDRNDGDPDTTLSLQLTDYDVNEWRVGRKERHRRGLEKVFNFIIEGQSRILASNGIEITISGSASHTGSKQYNDALSCKRATCVANWLRNQFSPGTPQAAPALLQKIKFTVGGKGFQEATCLGRDLRSYRR